MGQSKEKTAKTYEVRLSTSALEHFNAITGYIAFINYQPFNAVIVGDAIWEKIDRIATNPYLFRECEQLPTKNKIYRKAVCLSWIIIYKIQNDVITVIGIVHASRNPSSIKRIKRK